MGREAAIHFAFVCFEGPGANQIDGRSVGS